MPRMKGGKSSGKPGGLISSRVKTKEHWSSPSGDKGVVVQERRKGLGEKVSDLARSKSTSRTARSESAKKGWLKRRRGGNAPGRR